METMYSNGSDEMSYPIDYWYDALEDSDDDLMELVEMVEDKKNYVRWCSYYREFLEDGDECGKHCSNYIPKNGSRGKCIYKKYTLKETKNKITITKKALEEE